MLKTPATVKAEREERLAVNNEAMVFVYKAARWSLSLRAILGETDRHQNKSPSN